MQWLGTLFSIGAALVLAFPAPSGAEEGRSCEAISYETVISVSVIDFGAIPDDGLDDRPAFKAAIDSGAMDIFVPAGTYHLAHEPGWFRSIYFPPSAAGTRLRGEGRDLVTLRALAVPDGVQLIEINAPDVTIEGLTLDGDASIQSESPKLQRHGVRCKLAPRCRLLHLRSRNFTGDGYYLYDGADDAYVYDVIAEDNLRNGLTMGGRTSGGTFLNSQFVSNRVEQFDTEGDLPIDNITIRNCLLDARGMSGDYALTLTGKTQTEMSSGARVTDNEINGATLILLSNDVVFAHNRGTNASELPSIYVYKQNDRILIHRNEFTSTVSCKFDQCGMIYVLGTSVGQSAGALRIVDNKLTATAPNFGVSIIGARSVEVADNTLIGSGFPRFDPGVWVRATKVLEPVERIQIRGNTISNFGSKGVQLGGNGEARINWIEIYGNAFSDSTGTMLTALDLNDGWNEALDTLVHSNTISGGTTTMLVHPPAGTVQPWGDGWRWTQP